MRYLHDQGKWRICWEIISFSGNLKNKTQRTIHVTYSRPLCVALASRTALGMAVERFVFMSRQPIPDSRAAIFTASRCGVNLRSKLGSSLKIDMTIRTWKDSLKESRNFRNGC
jgi:hypothetical protein